MLDRHEDETLEQYAKATGRDMSYAIAAKKNKRN
jgi:hypothetical protein